jgi:restriction system protein
LGHRRSAFDDLLEFSSRLPVRTSVILAVVTFLVLHVVAMVLSAPATSGAFGGLVAHQLLETIAEFLQYIIPAGFLIGAVGSALTRSQGRSLFRLAASGARAAIADMSWSKFERLVGEAFRLKGYDVVETGGQGSDGGYDLVLSKDDGRVLVQCKHWKVQTVGVTVVRELNGVIAAQGATGGYVVTSGRFTPEARRFARDCGVELLDGDGLNSLIQKVDRSRLAEPDRATYQASPITCPDCVAAMKHRVAGRGAKIGQPFWGCSRFPSCRAIVPIA